MKKTYRIILVIVLCIAFSVTAFANDMIDESSNEMLRGIACECGGSLYNSNKTFSEFVDWDPAPCRCVKGQPDVCGDFKRTFNVYNTYVCSGCGNVTPRNFIGTQIKYYCPTAGSYYNYETGQVFSNRSYLDLSCAHENHNVNAKSVNQEELGGVLRSVICQCGGSLLPTNTLILSNYYEIAKYTVECKEYPGTYRRDNVWRYYFYNTYTCNKCKEMYERSKTQYYEDWGFCQDGSGKYPLHIINRIIP